MNAAANPTQIRSRILMAVLFNEWPSNVTLCDAHRAALHAAHWSPHAQATSECVQSCSSPFSHQQRSQRISPQLSLLFWIDRAGPPSDSTAPIRTRDAPLQKLRTIGTLRSRSSVEVQSVAQNLPFSPDAGLTNASQGNVRRAPRCPFHRCSAMVAALRIAPRREE